MSKYMWSNVKKIREYLMFNNEKKQDVKLDKLIYWLFISK